MKKNQFGLLLAVVMLLGVIGAIDAADMLSLKHEGKTGLKDMVVAVNDNVQSKTYYGTQGNLLRTTSTNVFSPAFASAPLVIVTTTDGVPVTNAITVAVSGATVVWGATNISYKMIAIGPVNSY
jgi:hypothetical protein